MSRRKALLKVPDPLLLLDQNLCVQRASQAFFTTFKVDRDETIGQYFYELGDRQWDIPELRFLLEVVIPKSAAVVDYEVEHDFPGPGRRTMLVSARRLFHPDRRRRWRKRALELLDDELPTVAILDVTLRDGRVTPVAEALRGKNIPCLVASAYSRPELIGGEILAGAPNVGKPTEERRLLTFLERVIRS